MTKLVGITFLVYLSSFWVCNAQNVSYTHPRFLEKQISKTTKISGKIYSGTNTADSVLVSLFREVSPGDVRFVNSAFITGTNGYYQFTNVAVGAYYILASLRSSKNVGQYGDTYYGNQVVWSDSKACFIQGEVNNKDIHLAPIQNSNGNQSISGTVRYTDLVLGYKHGDPVKNTNIYVFNASNELIANSQTSDAGTFHLNQLPAEQIKIFVSLRGKNSLPGTLDLNESRTTNIEFWVDDKAVSNHFTNVGVSKLEKQQAIIFPNPTVDIISLKNIDPKDELIILDKTGKLIEQFSPGEVPLSINFSAVDPGIYFFILGSGTDRNIIPITKN